MAYDGPKQPVVPRLLDPTPQTNQTTAPKKRRNRRSRSDLLAEEVERSGSLPHSESVKAKPHLSFTQVAVIFLAVYLGAGTLCFYLLRHQMKGKKTNGLLDAVYFCIVTMATVGYGDIVPNSALTKIIACVYVFTGMALVALLLGKVADVLVEKQGNLLVKALQIYQECSPDETPKENIETNKARHKFATALCILLTLMIVGTIVLAFVEKMSLVDSIYCVCITVATLGYGDKSFDTLGGRVFAVFWILTSTICLAQLFCYVAELNAERRQRLFVDSVLTRRMTNKDLEAADRDDDKVVDKSEFILHKLKEMGKISPEDISLILEKFQDLDVDQTGTLSASEIVAPAQSSETGK